MNAQQTEFILAHTPWSYSKIARLQRCPYSFYKYEVSGDRTNFRPPTDLSSLAGNVKHEFLDLLFKKKASVNEYVGFLNTKTIPSVIKKNLMRDYDSVHKIYKKILSTVSTTVGDKAVIQTEVCLQVAELYPICSNERPLLKGIIDLYACNAQTAIIIDHKSTGSNVEKFKEQLYFYCILVALSFPTLKRIKVYISDIRSSTLISVQTISVEEVRQKVIPEFISKWRELISPFVDGDEKKFTPKKSTHCKWCILKEKCTLALDES